MTFFVKSSSTTDDSDEVAQNGTNDDDQPRRLSFGSSGVAKLLGPSKAKSKEERKSLQKKSSSKDREKCELSPHKPKRSSVIGSSGLANLLKNTAMAPVVASRYAVKASVKGTQTVANVTSNAVVAGAKGVVVGGKVIMDGTTKTVAYGAKGVVGGGKAIMDGTGAVVGYGGRTVVAGATGLKKFTKAAMFRSFSHKSKREQGIDCIDSLLDPNSDTYKTMTPEQRKQLAHVKKILLKGGNSQDDKISHIPLDLIREQKDAIRQKSKCESPDQDLRASSNYILQEFAGVRNDIILDEMSDSCEEEGAAASEVESDVEQERLTVETSVTVKVENNELFYVPHEFLALKKETQIHLYHMLSWNTLSTWGFDIFELDDLTNGQPLLFMGWAILGYPHAQCAMARCCGLSEEHESLVESSPGYTFMDEFKILPFKLCNYMRAVEKDYHAENPYHNAIHAADVLQSLHALIQMTRGESLFSASSNIDLFAILLSAVVHDIDHPGKTNAFQANLRTELAVTYNDTSILENWHAAKAFARMLGVDINDIKSSVPDYESAQRRSDDYNILCNVSRDDFGKIRSQVIEAVLHTDMTKHFAMVNATKGLLAQDEEEPNSMAWKVLMFMLHLADISSQAKPDPLFRQWTVRCLDEFFDQGDMEAELGLPISPNCNRLTTKMAASQVGFIKFVVGPAYEVLGEFIPAVQADVLPIIESNLNVWIHEDEA